MCIIIDINCLPLVFNPKCSDNYIFKPVIDWIAFGKGKIVYGGSKYKEELKHLPRYFRMLINLDKVHKLVKIPDNEVDQKQKQIDSSFSNNKFDDSHLIAIVLSSGCKLICSNDSRSFPFLKRKEFYSGTIKRPKIYSSLTNTDLLADKNIADVCKPCKKTNLPIEIYFNPQITQP